MQLQPARAGQGALVALMGFGGAAVPFGASGAPAGVLSGAGGGFEMRGVEAGESLRLVAWAPGHQLGELELSPLGMDEERSGLEIRLERGGSLRVLASGRDGRPLEFGLVDARALDGSEGSSVEMALHAGEATLEGLAPGRWWVQVRGVGDELGPGVGPALEAEARIHAGLATELDLRF